MNDYVRCTYVQDDEPGVVLVRVRLQWQPVSPVPLYTVARLTASVHVLYTAFKIMPKFELHYVKINIYQL